MRLNLDTEEVELVVDGQVALTSGQDVLHSWVEALNEKHKPHRSLDEPVVEEVKTEPVVEVKETSPEELDTTSEPVVE